MRNINFYTYKIKNFFKRPWVRVLFVSMLTIIITLGIASGLLWHYRAQIFKILATDYIKELQLAKNTTDTVPQALSEDVNAKINEVLEPALFAVESDSVISSVKKAKPAVVSIIISKEVPKYSVSYQQVDPANDPFGGLFPGISLQTPVYTQDGTEKKEIGSGSGFLISSDGLIVTNRHVVASKDAIYEVLLNNGKKYQATVLARDTLFDVAIMKITAKGLPYLELADSDVLEVGQSVVAIGNALGEFKNTVSAGVVSGLSRSLNAGDSYGQTERLEKVIQTDAAINPGNSGGPLLNLKGEVVGINVAIVQGSSNIGFALPINSVKSAINSVKKSGKIIRPYIGVRYVNVTADLKIKKNLAVDYGVLVGKGPNGEVAVIAGSPADKAGIVENDIILSINGQKIDADHDFSYLIRSYNIGDSLKLRILSAGVEKTVTLRLAQAPDGV